jgi:hypothetical protein
VIKVGIQAGMLAFNRLLAEELTLMDALLVNLKILLILKIRRIENKA